MTDGPPSEYLLRVEPLPDGGGFAASVRHIAGTAHPEVREVLGPITYGRGRTELAACLHALAHARIDTVPAPREDRKGA